MKITPITNSETNTSANFKAKRILTATKGNELCDIFALDTENLQDLNFAKRCYDVLTKNSSKLETPQNKLQKFFKHFLQNQKNISDSEYIVAIDKDAKIASAGKFTSYAIPKGILLDEIDVTTRSGMGKTSVVAGFLKTIQDWYGNNATVRIPFSNVKLMSASAGNTVKEIVTNFKTKTPNIQFKNGDKKEIDLVEFLDIKDFEADRIR